MPDKPIDQLHQHEALHAAHMLTASFDEYVTESRFVAAHPEIKQLAEKAVQAMGDVYQAIGSLEIKKLDVE